MRTEAAMGSDGAVEMPKARAGSIRGALLIAGISAVPLVAMVAVGAAEQWFYVAAALLLLYLGKQERMALILLAGILVSIKALSLATPLSRETYDAALWRLDGYFGFEPSAWAIATLSSSPILKVIAARVYLAFPLEMALAFVFGRNANRFALKLATACVLGYLIQLIIPACGPIYFLLGETANPPRNAMPSLHLTWALLIWMELRERSLGLRALGDFVLIFTVVATIGSGEHYLVDLLAAVPFWLGVEWLWWAPPVGQSETPLAAGLVDA